MIPIHYVNILQMSIDSENSWKILVDNGNNWICLVAVNPYEISLNEVNSDYGQPCEWYNDAFWPRESGFPPIWRISTVGGNPPRIWWPDGNPPNPEAD